MSNISERFFRAVFISAMLFLNLSGSFAQDSIVNNNNNNNNSYENNKPRFWDRTYFGGGLALQFGSYTFIQVSPIMAYMVTEKFHVGVGLNYFYTHQDADPLYGVPDYTSNVYGGSLFSKYFLFPELFAYAEYGLMNTQVYNPFSFDYRRENINSFLVGGGYRQMVGRNAGIELLILYDTIMDSNSPYQNPIIRIGFVAGF